jgi:phosphoribosylamine--glycine ligase
MKVLVIGSGAREHALAWKLAQSEQVGEVVVSPGNGGTAREPGCRNAPGGSVPDWLALAQREDVDLTVVGPENPLADGLVDSFRTAGYAVVGPTRAAAQLESSKDFAKAFMTRHGIPTAAYATFTDAAAAHAYVDAQGAPIVVKADGLAAGKGVVVAQTAAEAHAAVDAMLEGNSLGSAGARVVIEGFLSGEEASFIVVAHGEQVVAFASSQDHKRLKDGDEGPNTGGMGAYSPAPVVTMEMHQRVMDEVIRPALRGMIAEGTPFTGFLYAGLMIGEDGRIGVLEFNCRMGDPETQPILMRYAGDFALLMLHAAHGTLHLADPDWDPRPALGVVLAAAGYPESPRKGDAIAGLPADNDNLHVFHAGTVLGEDGELRTSGGRVLTVTALGNDLRDAAQRAYAAADAISFEGRQMRRDIGHRALGKG